MDAVPGILVTGVILSLIVAAYWSLVVFPKQQDYRKHQVYIRRLHVGDEIVTYGGLIGTITELDPDAGIARIKLAEGIEIRVITAAIRQPYDPQAFADSARMGAPRDAQQRRQNNEV